MAQKSSKSEIKLVDPVAAAQLGNGSLPGGEVVGVDKIRELLFGNQMQDYDRRFSKLEERFLQRFNDIESETARNLSAFESNSKKQVDSLVGQLREEKDLRADADKELEGLLRAPAGDGAIDRRGAELELTVRQRLTSVGQQRSVFAKEFEMKTILLAAFLLYAGNEVAWAQIRHLYSAEKLAAAIGQGCVAQDTLDMQSKHETQVFSVRCKDGREFLLMIRKDGTASATECKQASVRCFKTYDEQGG